MTQPEVKSRISDPERIRRILIKAADAQLGVMIRLKEGETTAVRAKVRALTTLDGVDVMTVDSLSDKGIQYLGRASTCFVELVTISAKIIFSTFIVRFSGDTVMLTLPTELVNIERRKNARHPIPQGFAAFISLPAWSPKITEPESPPAIVGLSCYANWIRLGDLSMAGASARLMTPGLAGFFERGQEEKAAVLRLPAMDPLTVHCVIRWTKRVSDWTDSSAQGKFSRILTMGFEFLNLDENARQGLHQAIREFSTSSAV